MYVVETLSPNEATVKIYNESASDYLKNTPATYSERHAPLIKWLLAALVNLPSDAKIFEIGSGHGRDASFISSLGFNILCSDASTAFVDYLNKHGLPAIEFNAIADTPPGGYSMFLANAVVPHFTPENFGAVLRKIHGTLPTDGQFAFCTKQGSGNVWINEKGINGRFVHYWQPKSLVEFVESYGFKVTYMESDVLGGDIRSHKWIHIIIKKT